MNLEKTIQDDRSISQLTIAINSIIAQQVNDGRGSKPWIYADTRRMLSIAWHLDLDGLTETQQQGDHYGLVAETQAPANPKIEAIGKLLADELNALEPEPVKLNIPKKAAA